MDGHLDGHLDGVWTGKKITDVFSFTHHSKKYADESPLRSVQYKMTSVAGAAGAGSGSRDDPCRAQVPGSASLAFASDAIDWVNRDFKILHPARIFDTKPGMYEDLTAYCTS